MEEGRTRRDRLESRLERAIRKGRGDVAGPLEQELHVPPFPQSASLAWNAWQRIRRRKGAGPHGLAPVEWADIDAFVRLTNTPLTPLDITHIEDLDDLFLVKMSEEAMPQDRAEALKDGLHALGRKHQK